MIYYIYDEEMDIEWGPYTERSEAETNAAKISGDVAESRIDEFVEVAKRKVNEALISYTSACISVGAKYKFNKTE